MKIKFTITLLLLTATTTLLKRNNLTSLLYFNKGDSTAGNGWGDRYPWVAKLIQFQVISAFDI